MICGISADLRGHSPDKYVVDNSNKSSFTIFCNAVMDIMSILLGESGLKMWIRIWLVFLTVGVVSPFAFLPHPYAIANAAAFCVILLLNGAELVRIRGVNKNMGWPHVFGWIPVLVVDVLSLCTDTIDGEQITWANADNNYEKARVIFLWYNLISLIISCAFDVFDTIMYYRYNVKEIERSRWTVSQLEQEAAGNNFVDVNQDCT